MMWFLYSVLLFSAGQLELAAQVGFGADSRPLADQNKCQREDPEKEHLVGWRGNSLTHKTRAKSLQGRQARVLPAPSFSPPPPAREDCTAGGRPAAAAAAAASLLGQRRRTG
uniref:Secreted protein n=1 Tax=Micrurus lemniscatus lemniscatus TaxID=129467 RepID=A0A2D4HBW6_MICLE